MKEHKNHSKTLSRLRRALGLQPYSRQLRDFFDEANAKSGIVLSSIIMLLEFFMIGYVIFLGAANKYDLNWILQHIRAYIVLIVFSAAEFIYSLVYLQKRNLSHILGNIIRFLFTFAAIGFGIYITLIRNTDERQMLTFVTMEIFVMGFLIWRPAVSVGLITSSFAIFYVLMHRTQQSTMGFVINLTTFYIALTSSNIVRYIHELKEAKHLERIEDFSLYLEQHALTDELTGIPNKFAFRNRIQEIQKDEEDYFSRAYLYLDLINFKMYNEKFGFAVGNEFLAQVAKIIEMTFKDDPVAHFSDDHFIIFAKKSNYNEKLEALHKKITSLDSGISIDFKTGVFIPSGDEITPMNTACDYARYACDSIKHSPLDYCEYTSSMAEDFKRKQYIVNNIDTAIEHGWIKVYYQPVVFSADKKLCGFEALARWVDPEFGFLSPALFIPALEEYKIIHKLDAYIVKKVCRDLLDAPSQGIPQFPVSVNFSRLDFDFMDVEGLLRDNVEKNGIDKKYIHIEVTESALSSRSRHLQDTLNRLHEQDYSLWLDDFGSGYSGLNILKDYDFDMMKIDMGFLKNFEQTEKARPILKNIISLANDIGMSTLSEGVETEEAYEYLRKIGCERIQGYLFGKPMPAEEVVARIQAGEYRL